MNQFVKAYRSNFFTKTFKNILITEQTIHRLLNVVFVDIYVFEVYNDQAKK